MTGSRRFVYGTGPHPTAAGVFAFRDFLVSGTGSDRVPDAAVRAISTKEGLTT